MSTTPKLMTAAAEFSTTNDKILDVLVRKGYDVSNLRSSSVLTEEMYRLLQSEFRSNKESNSINLTSLVPSAPRKRIKINTGLNRRSPLSNRKVEKVDKEISPKEKFLKKYGPGTVFEATIIKKIQPALIVVKYFDGFYGKLYVQDISFCMPMSVEIFNSYVNGQTINCVVASVDFENNCVVLSQRHIYKHQSESIAWDRLERGDETKGSIVEILNSVYLVKTEQGFFGLLNKKFVDETFDFTSKLRIQSKNDENDVFSLVPASFDTGTEVREVKISKINRFSNTDQDLANYYSFKESILGHHATDDDLEYIRESFDLYPDIFSKEVLGKSPIYLQFTFNSSAYENIFKHNAIPYFLEGELFSSIAEEKVIKKLSEEKYWFYLNQRSSDNKSLIEFTLFNEEIRFFGKVIFSKNGRECAFLIENFSFGRSFHKATEEKKRNSRAGSYLLTSSVKILTPLYNLPLNNDHRSIVEYTLRKNTCFEIVDKLKLDAGEILRTAGKTLTIIDKFLEYQLRLSDLQSGGIVFVGKFERVPSETTGVCIKVDKTVADSLELDEESVINVKLKQNSFKENKEEEFILYSDATIIYNGDYCKIVFSRDVVIDLLGEGFYIEKKVSRRQLLVQREIIQDFLQKKIKIDHIESLLVKQDKVKTPMTAHIKFNNPDLERTEREQPDNNQVKAVKKAVGNQNIFLVQGPPGTGKTTVIAEIIEQLVAKGERILVAGQNHVAVDNVLEKIAKLPHLNLLRVGNPERVSSDLLQYTIGNLTADYKNVFATFLSNQLELIKVYYQFKIQNKNLLELKDAFSQQIDKFCEGYGRIKEVLKQRHFALRDGLTDFTIAELEETIATYQKWIQHSNNEVDLLVQPLIYNSVDVVFATCIGVKTDPIFRNSSFKFHTVIIDEAGKANIAETLVPVELGKKVILVGDQMQLPPYIDSTLIDEKDPKSFPKSPYGAGFLQEEIAHALKTSFFEFLINRVEHKQFPRENLEMLNYQHRMHPSIGEFVSHSFYGGNVKMGGRTHMNKLHFAAPFDKEVVFFDTSNLLSPYEQKEGCSVKNIAEAEAISEYILPTLFKNNVSASNIAIIAPYKSQVSTIQSFIKNSAVCHQKNIEVATLDSFQGKEFDIIIFSFTRSANHQKPEVVNGRKKFVKVGFLDDARRLNVAFSRAKKKLVFIGNAKTLTDKRSHYDGIFNYTELFTNLVELSKKPNIGCLVNIADYYKFIESSEVISKQPKQVDEVKEADFRSFISRYSKDDLVKGIIKIILHNKDTNQPQGIFLTVASFDSFIPLNQIPDPYKSLEWVNQGDELVAQVFSINQATKRVTLSLYNVINWDKEVVRLRRDGRYKSKIVKVLPFGCIVELNGKHLKAFIPKARMRNFRKIESLGADFSEDIYISVIAIDHNKRQLQAIQV